MLYNITKIDHLLAEVLDNQWSHAGQALCRILRPITGVENQDRLYVHGFSTIPDPTSGCTPTSPVVFDTENKELPLLLLQR